MRNKCGKRAPLWVGVAGLCVVGLVGVACDGGRPPVIGRSSASTAVTPRLVGTAVALDSFSARLTWSLSEQVSAVPPDGSAIEIVRNGRLIDRISSSSTTYTDYLLWERTTYAYDVRFVDRNGTAIAHRVVTVTTPPQGESFPRLYSPTSFWNTPIRQMPAIDHNSANVIAFAIARLASSATLVNTASYGYPIVYASPTSRSYDIGCTKYDCQLSVTFKIPDYARPTSGEDRHLVVIDPVSNRELDMFGASCCWTASSRYVTQPDGWGAVCSLGLRCNGSVAAGFAEAGGIIRPEEILQGHIDHALSLATPYTLSGYIACPATHSDGQHSQPAIPEGARVQLDPSLDVAAQPWPRWEKIVARALQVYGAYVADTGGSLEIRAEDVRSRGYDAWALAGVHGNDLTNLPWSRMRMLAVTPC